MGFEQAAREHIASRGARATRTIYLADLARWLVFCELEGVDPDAPPFPAAVRFRDALERDFAPLTVRRILSELSAMYDAAGLLNHFKSSKRLPRPGADEVQFTRAFKRDEVQRLLDGARSDLCDYAIMRVLYDTGLRIAEALRIRRSELHDRGDTMTLIARVKKKGRVETVLPEPAVEAIRQWLDVAPDSEWLFPASRGGGSLSTSAFRATLLKIAKQANVAKAHPHRFRATFATEAFDAGMQLHDVQAAMHHSDPKTTLRYDRGVRGTGVSNAVAAFRKGLKDDR